MVSLIMFVRSGMLDSDSGFFEKASDNNGWLLLLIGVAAIIDSINPCAFSVLLLTIAFLFSLGRVRSKIITIGGAYIFGLFVIYTLIGLGIIQALHFFEIPHFMAKIGALILILFGAIAIIDDLFPNFPIKLKIPTSAHRRIAIWMEKGSMPTAFILGILVGLYEFPCTGGPYLLVLGLLHDHTTYIKGLIYLIMYNAIFVTPLILILFIASDEILLEKVKSWKKSETKNMKLWGGVAMVALGIFIFML